MYARVSSHDQRSDLDRQVARLTSWATGNGHEVGEVVTEVGSGLNGKRPKLRRVLSDPSATVVVVEHRDRLARFGSSISKQRLVRMDAGSLSLTPAKPLMIWYGT